MSTTTTKYEVGDVIRLTGRLWSGLTIDVNTGDVVTIKKVDDDYTSSGRRYYWFEGSGHPHGVYVDDDKFSAELVEESAESLNKRLAEHRNLIDACGLVSTDDAVGGYTAGEIPEVEKVELGSKYPELNFKAHMGNLAVEYPHGLRVVSTAQERRDKLAAKRADDSQVIATAVGKLDEKLSSAVDRPAHYQFPGGVQPIDIAKHLSFNLGNVVKYVSRAGRKGAALEDLQKARYYLDLEIASVEAGE